MKDKRKTLDKKSDNLKLKKLAYKQKLQERGITLIALVVTIIILLILTGVTLNIALSDNGLFSKTKDAVEKYKKAENDEDNKIEIVSDYLEKLGEPKDKNGIYIYTDEDLKKFKEEVNSGTNFEGKNIYLMNDIDLQGNAGNEETWWTPIGNEENAFKGNFEGNNKQIKNMYCSNNEGSVGFFGEVEDATIKNLTVNGEIKTSEITEASKTIDIGGIVGKASKNTTIEGCSNKVNIESKSSGYTGGIIGTAEKNSHINIKNCENDGNVIGGVDDHSVGGCIGACPSIGEVDIDGFINKGDIRSEKAPAGGCVGQTWSNDDEDVDVRVRIMHTMNLCKEVHSVAKDSGGLVGYAGPVGSKVIIENSYNNSRVITDCWEAGGIIGNSDADTYCINVCNFGDLRADPEVGSIYGDAGGIIGTSRENTKMNIVNALNTGSVNATNYAGGIVGWVMKINAVGSRLENVCSVGNLGNEKIARRYGIFGVHDKSVGNMDGMRVENAFYMNADSGCNMSLEDICEKIEEINLKGNELVTKLNSYVTENEEFDFEIEGMSPINLAKWKLDEKGYPTLEI